MPAWLVIDSGRGSPRKLRQFSSLIAAKVIGLFQKLNGRLASLLQGFRKASKINGDMPSGESAGRRGVRLPALRWQMLYRKSFALSAAASVLCGYFAADLLVAGLLSWFPPGQPSAPRSSLAKQDPGFLAFEAGLIPRGRPHLFNAKGLVPDNDEGMSDFLGPPQKTSLPLNLLGLIVVQDKTKSVASVENKSLSQVIAVRVGDPITSDTEVQEITQTRLIFLNRATGRREYLELPELPVLATIRTAQGGKTVMPGVVRNSDGRVSISRDALKKGLSEDFGKILQSALCTPAMGGKAGFVCNQIEKGSIFEILGIKDGDIITAIDGESLSNSAMALQKLNELRTGHAQRISISVERNGRTFLQHFEFE